MPRWVRSCTSTGRSVASLRRTCVAPVVAGCVDARRWRIGQFGSRCACPRCRRRCVDVPWTGLASPSHPRCVRAGHDRHGCHQPRGLRRQPLTPSASITRSTARRFAATRRSNVVPATVMNHHPCSRVWASLRARTRLGHVPARQRSNFAGILDESTLLGRDPRCRVARSRNPVPRGRTPRSRGREYDR
jgi:hypothetical protein